ncbi:tetratricopeptide repeat protein [Marinobacter caseinilyticus]|uniref:tetratricopeptide repeat protein n=1 Tax=Marinobacter caseinilyticus TaxID=2692195 RepID=UPI00140CA312|nr:tetratricopeptide repeat protein [Marinobacter caseinilyticus]
MRALPKLFLLMLVIAAPTVTLLTGCGDESGNSEALSHINRSETYAEQGQYRSALIEVKNAIQKEPANVDYIVRLANLYLDVGAAKEASKLLSPWLESQPEAVSLTLAKAYVEQGKHLSAVETLDNVSLDSPERRTQANLIKAEARRQSGETTAALAMFTTLSDEHPDNVEAKAGEIRTRLTMQQLAEAVDIADGWTTQHGDSARISYLKGLAHYQSDNLEQAVEALTDTLSLLPDSDIFLPLRRDTLILLARTLTQQGKMTDAQIYNRILAENTNSEAEDQAQTAIGLIKEGKFEEAQTILKNILKLNPDNERVALILGVVSLEQGQHAEGMTLLTDNLDPETSPTEFIRAATMARIDAGERNEALDTLNRAIEARPNDTDLLSMHGILALSLPGHESEGVTSLSKVLGITPNKIRLRLALAKHYANTDKKEQALGQLRMAFTAEPAEWTATGTYLSLLLQMGLTKEVSELRDSLVFGYPDEPEARLLVSIADFGLGKTETAVTELETLVGDSPDFQEPLIVLAQLYLKKNQTEKAINTLLTAAEINPANPFPIQQASQIYALNHSAAEVDAWLESIGKSTPALQTTTTVLTSLLDIQQGNFAQARNKLTDINDVDAPPIAERAMAQLLMAEAQKAATDENWPIAHSKVAEAQTMQPNNLIIALAQVRITTLEGKYADAAELLNGLESSFGVSKATVEMRVRLLTAQAGTLEAYQQLNAQWQASKNPALMPLLVQLAKKEDPSAVTSLTEAWLTVEPESIVAGLADAEGLLSEGREQAAASRYKSVLEKQPENIPALNNLAWLLRESDGIRALEFAERASRLAPDNPAVLDTYGWILHLQGQNKQAIAIMEKAHAQAPDNNDIKKHLQSVKQAY